MTAAELKTSYDQAFPTAVWIIGSHDVTRRLRWLRRPVPASLPSASRLPPNYCIVSQNGSWYAWKHGPGGQIQVGQTLANICTATP